MALLQSWMVLDGFPATLIICLSQEMPGFDIEGVPYLINFNNLNVSNVLRYHMSMTQDIVLFETVAKVEYSEWIAGIRWPSTALFPGSVSSEHPRHC